MKNFITTICLAFGLLIGLTSCGDDPMDEMNIGLNIPDVATNPIASFGARSNHKLLEHKDELWLFAGVSSSNNIKSDIWKSNDGINWSKQLENAPFGKRNGHQVVDFNGIMHLIGGRDGNSNIKNDVWIGNNNNNWVELLPNSNFSPRQGHTATVFKDQIFVIAGIDTLDFVNDIWSTDTTYNFTFRGNAPFLERAFHTTTVFKDKLWVIGGIDFTQMNGLHDDIWVSEDGINWSLVTSSAPFGPISGHTTTVYKDRMYIIGGANEMTGDRLEKIWVSSDGINWEVSNENLPFASRIAHDCAAFNNSLILVAGRDTIGYTNDIWVME